MYVENMSTDIFGNQQQQKKEKNRNSQWHKAYELYKFDEIGYHRATKEYLQTNNIKEIARIQPTVLKEIKNAYYIKDDYGRRCPLGDERHIYRYQTLYKVMNQIALILTQGIEFNSDADYVENNVRIMVNYYDNNEYNERLAEIIDTHSLTIRERVILHLNLLRKLRKQAKNEFYGLPLFADYEERIM
jgi:hypothetical protein